MGPHPRNRRDLLVLLAGYAALLCVFILGLLWLEPYDDSYFFQRFALNLLHHGVLAWNVGDGPVYGNTSQLFQLVAAAVVAVTRDHYVFVMRVVLACGLLAGFACALRLSRRRGDPGVMPTLLFCSPIVLFTAVSGMETALVFGGLVLFLLILEHDSEGGAWWVMAPVAMIALYLLRPDSLALTGVAWAGHRVLVRRRVPLHEVIALAAGFAATLAALKLYYGMALPTSFYLKSSHFSTYGAHFRALCARSKRQHLLYFVVIAAPFVYVALHRLEAWSAVLLAAAAVFAGYHTVETVDVMGMHSRFYAPALVYLAAAAVPGVQALRARGRWLTHIGFLVAYPIIVAALYHLRLIPTARVWIISRVAPGVYAGWIASVLLLGAAALGRLRTAAAGMIAATAIGAMAAHPLRWRPIPNDHDYLTAELHHTTTWRGIRKLKRCLGGHISIYHSEIGLAGAMLPDAHIKDLAGLMAPSLVLDHPSFDDYCLRELPDAIFLPHRNYRALNREIMRSQCIRRYARVVARGSSPLYIRRDLLPAYRSCRGSIR